MFPSPQEDNLDVLQNIELAIMNIYRDHPELTDYQVDAAVEALGRTYHREKIGGAAVLPKGDLSKQVYEGIKLMCDWRLGRHQMVDDEGQPMAPEPITVVDLLDALKRIRKSVQLWNKEGGSQGYLNYVQQFFPG